MSYVRLNLHPSMGISDISPMSRTVKITKLNVSSKWAVFQQKPVALIN